jgi:CarD family transcriptional regulator
VECKEFIGQEKRYYVIEIPFDEMTVHVPVGRVDEVGLRPVMPRAKVTHVGSMLKPNSTGQTWVLSPPARA